MINSDLNKITAAATYGKSFHEFSFVMKIIRNKT